MYRPPSPGCVAHLHSMRILLVSHSANNPNSGASRVYHLLCEGLQKRGHYVRCLHLDDLGIPKTRFAAKRLLIPFFASRAARRALRDPFDVVMCSNGMLYMLYRQLHKQQNRPVLVQHYHGLSLFDHQAIVTEALRGNTEPSFVYSRFTARFPILWDKCGARYSDLVIVQNDRDADAIRKYTSHPIFRVPLALQPEIAQAGLSSTPMDERIVNSLVWFGSWSSRKGCAYLPAAFARVAESFPDATLTLGGTGKGETLKRLFAPHLRERIIVLPHISIQEQIQLFNTSCVFLFPSLSEGFGFALLEALSMGMACVTTQTGLGADWLRDHETALIVSPASSIHLAEAIKTLLRDGDLREKLSANGRRLAQSFTTEWMLSEYEQIFANGVRSSSAA